MIAEIEGLYTRAVERALASTVNVATTAGPFGPPFGPHPRRGHGSGVVLDPEGHILTSEHVVAGAAKVVVTRGDGRVFAGTVLGADEGSDVAVVRIEASDLTPAAFGDSDGLRIGQPVLAIGNPLGLSGGPSVTSGVVSSLRRSVDGPNGDRLRMIQTDAAVNPGNSGGPLVDLQGRVVGILAATIPHAEGIGFAIPINAALEAARQIVRVGRVERPWLGIVGHMVDRRVAQFYGLPPSRGVFVVEATPGGPAETAGIHVGDILTGFDARPLHSLGDLLETLADKRPGDPVDLERDRRGTRDRVRVSLGIRPF